MRRGVWGAVAVDGGRCVIVKPMLVASASGRVPTGAAAAAYPRTAAF